ncbi:MAG: Lrp/AsnC ligand binding domain-containing protein, partial [Nanoarchaeota archaeon]
ELKQEGMKIKDLMKIIRNSPLVESTDNVTGDVDVVVKMHVRDINELNDYVVNTLSYYKGVEKTKTALVLKHN